MWYRDIEKGEMLLQAMKKDLAMIDEGVSPADLGGWAPADVNDMLTAWGFGSEVITGPALLRWHLKHIDLDIVIPFMDPLQYSGVIKPAVDLVDTLKQREAMPIKPIKGGPKP